jgi:hypothetical protein
MDGGFLPYYPTLGVLSGWLQVTGDDVHAFHQHPVFIREYLEHFARFFGVLVITGDHHYGIAFFDVEFRFESVAHFYWLVAGLSLPMNTFFLLSRLRRSLTAPPVPGR